MSLSGIKTIPPLLCHATLLLVVTQMPLVCARAFSCYCAVSSDGLYFSFFKRSLKAAWVLPVCHAGFGALPGALPVAAALFPWLRAAAARRPSVLRPALQRAASGPRRWHLLHLKSWLRMCSRLGCLPPGRRVSLRGCKQLL